MNAESKKLVTEMSHPNFHFQEEHWRKDIKITCKNRPVVKPCCSGLPNGLPPLIASRILSLKLQSMTVWILLCCMEKRVDIEPTPK
jgi:hypothetical protein